MVKKKRMSKADYTPKKTGFLGMLGGNDEDKAERPAFSSMFMSPQKAPKKKKDAIAAPGAPVVTSFKADKRKPQKAQETPVFDKPTDDITAETDAPQSAEQSAPQSAEQGAGASGDGQEVQQSAAIEVKAAAEQQGAAPKVRLASEQEEPGLMDRPRTMIIAAIGCALMLIVIAVFLPVYYAAISSDVIVNDNGFKVTVHSTAATVGEVLNDLRITVNDYDYMECGAGDSLTDNMEIVIRRALPVYVNHAEQTDTVHLISGTVADAVAMAGITVDGDDEVYPSMEEYIAAGMLITYIDVNKQTVVENEPLSYSVITKKDDSMWEGKEKTVVEGETGLMEVTTEVTYKNGVETAREALASDVIFAPVDEVIHIGTMITMQTEMGRINSAGKLLEVPTRAQIYSGSLSEHKSAPPPSKDIIAKTMVARYVTAYAGHTQSSSGRRPQVGTVACYWKILPKNTKIYVPGYGYGVIEDQGGNTNTDHLDLDLFMENSSQTGSWGRKRNKTFYVLK